MPLLLGLVVVVRPTTVISALTVARLKVGLVNVVLKTQETSVLTVANLVNRR